MIASVLDELVGPFPFGAWGSLRDGAGGPAEAASFDCKVGPIVEETLDGMGP